MLDNHRAVASGCPHENRPRLKRYLNKKGIVMTEMAMVVVSIGFVVYYIAIYYWMGRPDKKEDFKKRD